MTTKQLKAIENLILVASELRIVVGNQDLTMTRQGEETTLAKYLDRVDSAITALNLEISEPIPTRPTAIICQNTFVPTTPNFENSDISHLCR